MRDVWKLAWRLLVIALVAALALGLTNYYTKGPIEQQNIEAANLARRRVFADCDTFDAVDISSIDASGFEGTVPSEVYAASDGEGQQGYACKMVVKGYGGDVEVTVGVKADGTLSGISVGSHSETAGLGANATKPEFQAQFADRAVPLTVSKNASAEDEIQALTGATITSRAVTGAANDAAAYCAQFLDVEKAGE